MFQKLTDFINRCFGHWRLSFDDAKISDIDMFKLLDFIFF